MNTQVNRRNRNGRKRVNRNRPRTQKNNVGRTAVSQNQLVTTLSSVHLPRTQMRLNPFPVEMVVRSTYASTIELFSGVNAYAVKDLVVNDVRQPDRAVSEDANGYAWYSQVYRAFRVTHCAVFFDIANVDASPINVAFVFNDTQPSTLITTWASARQVAGSGITTGGSLVGGITGNSLSRNHRMKIALGDVVGGMIPYLSNTSYAGSDAASPTQSIWGSFIAWSYDGATAIPDGVAVNANFIFTTRYYSMRPI